MPTLALSAAQQATARAAAVAAAQLTYQHKPVVHYTQGPDRWQGIATDRIAARGEYPNWADCSSFATWCLWNALYVPYGMVDVVNAQAWRAGYTGTMLQHGTPIYARDMLAGDCVLYGRPGSTGAHTAICVGSANGRPMVISHGSESGPHYLSYDYRSDVMAARRYIDGRPHDATRPPPVASSPPAPAAVIPPTEDEIMAISSAVSASGALHVFYEAKDGSLWYTWQPKNQNAWEGGKPGKQIAGLRPFAPNPTK